MKTEILTQMGIINELNSMVVKALGIEKQYLRHDLLINCCILYGPFSLTVVMVPRTTWSEDRSVRNGPKILVGFGPVRSRLLILLLVLVRFRSRDL